MQCETGPGWISVSEAVMSMNWGTHWLTESFPGPPAHPSTPGEPGWAGWDESQSNSEPAVILYKTYTQYFCWLLHDISKVAGKPGHLLARIQINSKHRGKQVKLTPSGEDRTPSKFAHLSWAQCTCQGNILFSTAALAVTEKYEAWGKATALRICNCQNWPATRAELCSPFSPPFPPVEFLSDQWLISVMQVSEASCALAHLNSPFHYCQLLYHPQITTFWHRVNIIHSKNLNMHFLSDMIRPRWK